MSFQPSLYERLGGDAVVTMAVANFFDEMCEDEELRPFFDNMSISALKIHQIKLFRVIFGPEEERPSNEELSNYMLATHTRLFRDQGLNEMHFERVISSVCVSSLATLQVDQALIDECIAILEPLRGIFEHGAKVAAKEKTYTIEQIRTLPTTTAFDIGTDKPSILPDPAWIGIPTWLKNTLATESTVGEVRAWTCALTDRFGGEGDEVIADTYLDMPYMNHHVYNTALLQLAFLPEGMDPTELLRIVRFPRGPDKPALCASLWERMIVQFEETCKVMLMRKYAADKAVEKLRSYTDMFPKKKIDKVGGLDAPHILRRPDFVKIDVSALHADKFLGKLEGGGSRTSSCSDSITVAHSVSSNTSGSSGGKPKRRVWRRLFGWSKAH